MKKETVADIMAVLLGILIVGVIKALTGNWVDALVFGTVIGLMTYFFIRTSLGEDFVNFSMMFFAWCGGVPRADLGAMSARDQLQYARTGATLLIPTTLAFVGAWFVASDVYHAEPIACAGIAIVWSWIIFTIDAALIATMKRNRSLEYSWTSLSIRVVLALALGILVSSILELRIFQKEIRQEFDEQLQVSKSMIDSSEHADIAVLQSRIDKEQVGIDTRESEMRREMDQSLGGRSAGYGAVARKKEAMWLSEKEKFEHEVLPVLLKEIESKKQLYADKRSHLEENFSDGIASRLEYLSDAGEKHGVIQIAHFFIFVFLIALELIPVIAKMMAPPTEYELEKAQGSYQKELETLQELNTLIAAEATSETVQLATVRRTATERQKLSEDLESQRIDAVLAEMTKVHTLSQQTGKNLDEIFEKLSHKISEKPQSKGFWSFKKGKTFA